MTPVARPGQRGARRARWPGRTTYVATPSFDGAHWDEEEQAGKHPTIKNIFENLHPEAPGTEYGDNGRLIGSDGKAMLYNGRTGEEYDNPVSVGLHLHLETGPPRGRQDPRPVVPAPTR